MGRGKKLLILSAGFLLALLAGAAVYFPAPEPFVLPKDVPPLIAHGGGSIEGHRYTNSREAVERSIAQGYKLIEIDLLVTTDGKLLAAHDLGLFRDLTGYVGPEDDLTLETALAKKLKGRFTPMGGNDLDELFSDPSLYLVTDKDIPVDVLVNNLAVSRDRLIVEVYSYAQYRELLGRGIKYPLLNLPRRDLYKYAPLMLTGKIRMICVKEKTLLRHTGYLRLLRNLGVAVFVATGNDPEFVRKHVGDSASAFYTDDVLPGDLSLGESE